MGFAKTTGCLEKARIACNKGFFNGAEVLGKNKAAKPTYVTLWKRSSFPIS